MSTMQIRKAVIPAAGLGIRSLPATKVVPKELLPIAGRPLIQYAMEEAAASGIETVVLVLGPRKELIEQYFSRDQALEETLTTLGYDDEMAEIRRLAELVEIKTVWQKVPTGLASAIALAEPVIQNEPFAVILPDALIDAGVPCTRQLMDCYHANPGCVIATQAVEPHEVERFGMVETEVLVSSDARVSRVTRLLERPAPGMTKSKTGIFGRYVLRPGIFNCISRLSPGRGGEFQLTDALSIYSQSAPVYAYQFIGEHFDVGSKLGFVQATLRYALRESATAAPISDYLARLELPIAAR